MKKIVKLTIFSFLGPFAATFFIVLFVLLMQFLWKYIDDLVGKGLEWYVIGELLFYASASFVPLALPLAILLSSIMSFGKLAETYELVALKSAGLSLIRIMMPMIVVVVLFSTGAFFFTNIVIPRANLKFQSLLWDIRQQRPALDIRESAFYSGIDNYSIRINHKDKKDPRKIEGITIYDHTRGANEIVMTAQSGMMYTTPDSRWLIMKLYNGTRYEEMESKSNPPSWPDNRLNFKSYDLRLDLSVFKLNRTKEELFKDNYQMLNIVQLQEYSDSLQKLREKKLVEITEYTKPYFFFLRDTPYHYHTNLSHLKIPPDKTFIQTLPKVSQGPVLLHALNNARSVKELVRVQQEELDNLDKDWRKYMMEWHKKFALSLACLTLFFIGTPLGAIIRKGGIGMPTVVSIFMFLLFYVLNITGEKMGKEGAAEPIWAIWVPTFILLPIGFFLTYRANRDTIRLNFANMFYNLRAKRWVQRLIERFQRT